MRTKIIALAILVSFFGHANAQDIGPPIAEQETLFARAKEATLASLKDPDSAQFKDLEVSQLLPSKVCGYLNAKNSFGGYTGFHPFIYDDKTGKVDIVSEAKPNLKIQLTIFRLTCKPRGAA